MEQEQEQETFESYYEIHCDNEITNKIGSKEEAERRFRNTKAKGGSAYCYLYRMDYNSKGKLIESYMVG